MIMATIPLRTRLMGVVLVLLTTGGLAFVPNAGWTQSQDWSVQENDQRRREVVKRYQKLLEQNPVEGPIFEKLVQYVGTGEGLEQLVASYRERVENHPEQVHLRLVLGHLLKKQNADDEALTHYDRAVDLAPERPVVWMSRGALYTETGDDKKAVSDYEKALERVSKRSRQKKLLRELADLAFEQRDWSRAESYYDRLIELDPRNEYLRMEYTQVLVEHERYEKALEQYRKLLEFAGSNPKSKAKTLRDMGDLYEKMGRGEKAIETYRRAMELMRPGHWLHDSLQERVVEAYRSQDRLDELLAAYERQWSSPNYEQSMTLGRLSDDLGRTDEALDDFRRASRLRSGATEPIQRRLQLQQRQGNDTKVIALHERLIRLDPQNEQFRFDLVKFYFQIGARDKAVEALERIRRQFRGQPNVYRQLANTYMRYDMGAEARDIYKTLVELEPDNPSYITNLGESYYRSGQLEKAVETWTRLLESSLQEAEARARLGRIFSEHGMIERGIRNYRKAVEIKPDKLAYRRGLASTYEEARRWEKAIEIWREIMTSTDKPEVRSEARGRIIGIYKSQNQLRAKLEEFERRFRSDPPNLEAGYFLAEGYVKLSQYDRAETVYRDLVEADNQVDESDIDALQSLQTLYRQTGDLESAIEVLQQLAELQPRKQRDYYHRIAELSLKLYADEQAIKYAALAVEKNPDDADAHARLGGIYRKMQRLDAAIKEYRQAVDLDPQAHRHALKLADLLVEVGEPREAETYYLRVAKQARDNSLILKAARRAIDLALEADRLRVIEQELAPLVYESSEKRIYRKVMLEIYEHMITPLIVQRKYGLGTERETLRADIDAIATRATSVLTSALEADDVGQRALAIRLLGGMRESSAATELARMAIDPDEPLRTLAAISAAQIGDSRAVAPLVEGLDSDHPDVRDMATWALGYIGGGEARDALIQQLDKAQNDRQQTLAAIGLGRIGGSQAASALRESYSTLQGSSARDSALSAVVWAMGRTRDGKVVPRLKRALLSGRDGVRDLAADGLAGVGTASANRALLEGLWSGRPTIREASIRGLSRLAARLRVEQTDERQLDSGERRASLVADLGAIDDRQHRIEVRSIVQRLRRASTRVGTSRGDALFARYHETLAESIGDALEAEAPVDVRTTLDDLHDSEGPRLGPLEPTTDDGEEALMRALIPHEDTLQRLARLDDPGRAAPAIELVGWMTPSTIEDLLFERIDSGPTAVRTAAARTLGELPADDTRVGALMAAFESSSYRIRKAACQGLGSIVAGDDDDRRDDIVSALETRFVDDRFSSVRIAAIDALGTLGGRRAVSAITEHLDDLPTRVKLPALRTLSSIDHPMARKALDPYRDSSDVRIRRAVGDS